LFEKILVGIKKSTINNEADLRAEFDVFIITTPLSLTYASISNIFLNKGKINSRVKTNVVKYIAGIKLLNARVVKNIILGLPDDSASSCYTVEDNILSAFLTLGLSSSKFLKKTKILVYELETTFLAILQRIFDFETYRQSGLVLKNGENYSASDLMAKLRIDTCPYCNRSFTFTIKKSGLSGKSAKIITPEIDHFFPRKHHPLLSISYYNLIPSCSNCNRFKSSKPVLPNMLVHPYIEGFRSDATFSLIGKNVAEAKGYSGGAQLQIINTCRDTAKKKRIIKNISYFKLNKIYVGHSEHAKDIVKTVDELDKEYVASIQKLFKDVLAP
jgi:hypothetical protein